jgi:hypothetical protein
MREIIAGKLRKILKEHKRWCDTDEDEGEKASLRGANLGGAILIDAYLVGADLRKVLGLNIEQLSTVETLYKAKLDPELMEQLKDEYPHLLKKPKSEE